ncbi:MAG: phosphatidylinositol-specific phospholipase C domain-containing protein [Candidatus Weimeria sp.]
MQRFFRENRTRLISALVIFVLLIVCFANAGNGDVEEAVTDSKRYKSTTEWMQEIDDDTPISAISIPGTHDSAAVHIFPGFVLKTQTMSIADQLTNGFRYLDIRLEVESDKDGDYLGFVHSFGKCRVKGSIFSSQMRLEGVLDQIYAFLRAHPSETVLFCVKDENSSDDSREFEELLFKAINQNKSAWYLYDSIPKLSAVRGKIVLLRRFDDSLNYGNVGLNFTWKDQGSKESVDLPYVMSSLNGTDKLWVQDRYHYTVGLKKDVFLDMLRNVAPDDNTFTLNFLSTAGDSSIGDPKGNAEILNNILLSTDLAPQTAYGTIVVDFGTRQIAQHIYMSNFPDSDE